MAGNVSEQYLRSLGAKDQDIAAIKNTGVNITQNPSMNALQYTQPTTPPATPPAPVVTPDVTKDGSVSTISTGGNGTPDVAKTGTVGVVSTTPTVDPYKEKLDSLMAALAANQATAANQRNAQIAKANDLTSTANYTKLLSDAMAQLQPSYNVGEAQIKKDYADNEGKINIDAERRGVYDSGAAAQLVKDNLTDQNTALAKLMADIRAQAATQANTYVNQQLQALGMQGDWTSSDLNSAINVANSGRDSTLGLGNLNVSQQNATTNATNVSNQYELGKEQNRIDSKNADTNATNVNNQYNLGVEKNKIDKQNADTSSTKVGNDYTLGLGQLDVDKLNANTNKQNADTNATKVKNDFTLGTEQNKIDKQTADAKTASVANEYDIALKQIGLDKSKLAENARQFNNSLNFQKIQEANDASQFAQSMGLNWAQLDATTKAAATNALLDQQKINLQTKQFNSEQELINAQRSKDNLQQGLDAYNFMSTLKTKGATLDDVMLQLSPYKSANPSLYNDLVATAKSMYNPATGTGGTASKDTTIPNSANGGIYNPATRSYIQPNIDLTMPNKAPSTGKTIYDPATGSYIQPNIDLTMLNKTPSTGKMIFDPATGKYINSSINLGN